MAPSCRAAGLHIAPWWWQGQGVRVLQWLLATGLILGGARPRLPAPAWLVSAWPFTWGCLHYLLSLSSPGRCVGGSAPCPLQLGESTAQPGHAPGCFPHTHTPTPGTVSEACQCGKSPSLLNRGGRCGIRYASWLLPYLA